MYSLTCTLLVCLLVTLAFCSSAKEKERDKVAKNTATRSKKEMTTNKKASSSRGKKEVRKYVKKIEKKEKGIPAEKELHLERLPQGMIEAIKSIKRKPISEAARRRYDTVTQDIPKEKKRMAENKRMVAYGNKKWMVVEAEDTGLEGLPIEMKIAIQSIKKPSSAAKRRVLSKPNTKQDEEMAG